MKQHTANHMHRNNAQKYNLRLTRRKNPKTNPWRGWEYLNSFIFEFPLHFLLTLKVYKTGLTLRDLPKVNWSLDQGGLAFASKTVINSLFERSYFLPSILVKKNLSDEEKLKAIRTFSGQLENSFPLIAKPDIGRVGKAVIKIASDEDLKAAVKVFHGDFIVEEFSDLEVEFGVFYYKLKQKSQIFSISEKKFPSVTGDGQSSIKCLIEKDSNLVNFKNSLSQKINFDKIPEADEKILLSYVGNHSQGAGFSDSTHLINEKLLHSIDNLISPVPGFNYGRIDLKSASTSEFMAGNFTVIEVNGIDSLDTSIFDPQYSWLDAYKILWKQYNILIEAAKENQTREYNTLPFLTFIWKWLRSEKQLSFIHRAVLETKLR